MLMQCLSLNSSPATTSPATINNHHRYPPPTPSPPPPQANSTDGTPRSSTQLSPTVNLTRLYTSALQTNSFKEILATIQNQEVVVDHENHRQFLLSEILNPNRECVEEALQHARTDNLTRLVSLYLDESENTVNLCLLLHQRINVARQNYDPIHNLIENLPHDSPSLSLSECHWALDVFHHFNRLDNPFPSQDSHNFHEMQRCFSHLKPQLDKRLNEFKPRFRLCQHGKTSSALCLIGTAVAVVASAAAVATHALVAIVAFPLCAAAYFPRNVTRKEAARIAQLDAALFDTYVLKNYLDSIDRLVTILRNTIEDDKFWIRLGLERGMDMYLIQGVVKQLRENHVKILMLLNELEEHLITCLSKVNKARESLLEEIHL
ncbi:DUF677 domain-containing protein [Cephalotus follicularis]|uniref:DUF677 domain-containing protein n=1 Tax=Cephalotus follicularis TaxID=3775 RepID=A0A1Q3DFJ0_CEPFO|nr:DUF677 domain-containing protein [Cephalotus follicularis]